MQSGGGAHFRTRILVSVIIMLLVAFPILAQSGKNRAKAPDGPANESAGSAENQAAAESASAPPFEKAINPPAKPGGAVSAKVAGAASAKNSAAAAPKTAAPAAVDTPADSMPLPGAAVAANSDAPASAQVNAAESTNTAAASTVDPIVPAPGSGWVELIKTIGSVGLILSLILAGYILFRKYAPPYLAKKPGERNLRLLETLPMGDKRSIVMVQAGAQRFLLASTPGQISLLTALPASAGTFQSTNVEPAELPAAGVYSGNFRNLYEQEKKISPVRPGPVKALPPDIRGKMQELRKALEG